MTGSNGLYDDGDGYCGECKKKLTEKNRYSDWTCKDCAKEM